LGIERRAVDPHDLTAYVEIEKVGGNGRADGDG
jgi:hypothetical protein